MGRRKRLDSPSWIDKGAPAVTAIFTLVTTIAGAVTALGGGGARVLVNHPDLGWTSIALVATGITVALFGAFVVFPGRSYVQQRRRAIALAISSVFILAGFLLGLRATALTASRSDQPTITATLQTGAGLTLDGSASTDAVAQNEKLFVEIRGFSIDPFSAASVGKDRQEISDLLFASQAGPTTTGAVAVPFMVVIRPGLYELVQVVAWTPGAPLSCRETPQGSAIIGCLSIRMPASAVRPPQLDVSFEGTGPDRVAVIHLTASTTDTAAMVLSVVGKPADGVASIRSQALVTTNNGIVDRTIRVPVGDAFHDLCAFVLPPTSPELSVASCPPPTRGTTVWVWVMPVAPP